MSQDPSRPHLTERELAARWQAKLRTVQRWRREKRLPPHFMVGRLPIFPLAEVLAFEAALLKDEGSK